MLSRSSLDWLLSRPMLWFVILSLSFAFILGNPLISLCWIPCFLNRVFFFTGFLPTCLRLCMPENGFESAEYSQESFSFCTERHSSLVFGCRCLGTWREKEGWWRAGVCFSDKYIDCHLISLFSTPHLLLSFLYLLSLSPGSFWLIFTRNQSQAWEFGRGHHQALWGLSLMQTFKWFC